MNYLQKMRIVGIFLITFFTVSCSSKQLTLEDYASQVFKFEKQKVNYNNDFELYIPKNWDWKVEDYGTENFIFIIDASSSSEKDGSFDFISIQKVKSFSGKNDLKSEYNHLLNISQQPSKQMKITEFGETDIFKDNAYFIHSKSEKEDWEMISFVLEGQTEGTFYYLTAGTSQTKDLKKNMGIIIQSLKTFKINKTE